LRGGISWAPPPPLKEGSVDRYTKGVLTVIAAMLAQNAVQPTRAQVSEPLRVQICDFANRCAAVRYAGSDIADQPYNGVLVVSGP
jgi:hypothetical protein